jgi:uncharacterized protein (DUF433 family)
MYSEAEAARLLDLSQGTLNYWLEGGERRGVSYAPVIRPAALGNHPPVTWAEFVEAGLLRAYRRDHRVPMHELRAFISLLRDKFGVPYPLADRRPFVVENGGLVFEAQNEAKLAEDWWLVENVNGQFSLLPQAEGFVHRVEWRDGVAAGWHPDDNPLSPVVIDPERRFGRPTVGGISTSVLWEQAQAGIDVADIAEDYELNTSDVEWAVSYESARRTA